jgi:hypothetical protein
MELNINNVLYEVTELTELQVHLRHVGRRQFSELWMHGAVGWPALCALINGDASWLMYLRFEGDAGFPLAIPIMGDRRRRKSSITSPMVSATSIQLPGISPPPKRCAPSNISLNKEPWPPGCNGAKGGRRSLWSAAARRRFYVIHNFVGWLKSLRSGKGEAVGKAGASSRTPRGANYSILCTSSVPTFCLWPSINY